MVLPLLVRHRPASLYSRGQSDGSWDNQHCTDSTVFLDWGQPNNHGAVTGDTRYYGYGTTISDYSNSFVGNADIVYQTEQYANGWYNTSGLCAHLHLVLGTNNYQECPNGYSSSYGTCDIGAAGRAWGDAVNQINIFLSNQGRISPSGGYITAVWAGDDIEGQGQGYDCAGPTRSFVDGFNNNNPSGARLLDFGDPFTSSGCFAGSDIGYVAWGALSNWPFAENYATNNNFANTWQFINSAFEGNNMSFLGTMTECTSRSDPFPDPTTCPVGSNTQFAPRGAWQGLQSAVPQGSANSMAYATNIQYQQ